MPETLLKLAWLKKVAKLLKVCHEQVIELKQKCKDMLCVERKRTMLIIYTCVLIQYK